MFTQSGKTKTLALLTLLIYSSAALAGGGNGKNETAITLWLVIINNPAACSGAPCSEADIFGPAFTEPPPADTNPTQATVCYLGGQSVQANGRFSLGGRFAEGSNHGCFFPDGSAYGLIDADTAEVHSVLQRHGWSLMSGEGLEEQIGEFMGACNPGCVDTQFTIHEPGGGAETVSDVYFFPPDEVTPPAMVDGANNTLTRESDGIRMIWNTRLAEDE